MFDNNSDSGFGDTGARGSRTDLTGANSEAASAAAGRADSGTLVLDSPRCLKKERRQLLSDLVDDQTYSFSVCNFYPICRVSHEDTYMNRRAHTLSHC